MSITVTLQTIIENAIADSRRDSPVYPKKTVLHCTQPGSYCGKIVTCEFAYPDIEMIRVCYEHPVMPPSKHAQCDHFTVPLAFVSPVQPVQATLPGF